MLTVAAVHLVLFGRERMRIAFPIIGVLSILLAPCASAATVETVQGQTLINRGQGYKLIEGSTEAYPGTTVVANPGSSAQVVYPDGCKVAVNPGSVYTIAPKSPCETGEAGGGTGLSTTWLIVGGVLAAGGGAAALLLAQKAASP
jgi:hypothetical protein